MIMKLLLGILLVLSPLICLVVCTALDNGLSIAVYILVKAIVVSLGLAIAVGAGVYLILEALE